MAKEAVKKISFQTSGAKKRTSIGAAKASRPKNKRADRKRYRGQGRP